MNLDNSLKQFEATKDNLRETGLALMQAAGGRFYPLDFLALAAINRTLHIMPAFKNAIETRNFFVVAPLMRLHVDSCLRFSAAWLVDEPHKYASEILDGVPTSKLKDSAKQKMTDTYLVETMSAKYPWIKPVYKNCSGFVHLSRVHILPMLTAKDKPEGDEEEGQHYEIAIGFGTVKLDEMRYFEAVEGFNAATDALLDLLEGWLFTKEHPETVARIKAEGSVKKIASQ